MSQFDHLCGFVPHQAESDRIVQSLVQPYFGATNKDSGKGQDCFLWLIEQQLTGQVSGPDNQKIPDCVSHAFGRAIDVLRYVRIFSGLDETFIPTATEPIYGGARIQIGKGILKQPGCVGAWALDWLLKFGITGRQKYPEADLSFYNPELAQKWGQEGSPITSQDSLLKLASKCTSYEQARDAIVTSKLPIVVCSDQAFSLTRDNQGFCLPDPTDVWMHSIHFIGVTDNPLRPGIVYRQSWGPGVPGGPRTVTLPHGPIIELPDGCFLVDAEVFDDMIQPSHSGEAYILCDMEGYHPRLTDFTFAFY
jgi:hypothetical protein